MGNDEAVVEVTPGKETSEHAVAKSGSTWAIVAMVIGLLTTVGTSVAASFGADTKTGIIVGAVVAGLAIFQKTVTDLGYIKSRTDVKVAKDMK